MNTNIPLFESSKYSLKDYVTKYYGNPYVRHLERAILDNVSMLNWTDLQSITNFVKSLKTATNEKSAHSIIGYSLRYIYEKYPAQLTTKPHDELRSQIFGAIYVNRDTTMLVSFLDTDAQQILFQYTAKNTSEILDFIDGDPTFTKIDAYLKEALKISKKMNAADKEKFYKSDGLAYLARLLYNSNKYGLDKARRSDPFMEAARVACTVIPDLFKYCLIDKDDRLSFFVLNLYVHEKSFGESFETVVSELSHKYFKIMYPDEYEKYKLYKSICENASPEAILSQLTMPSVEDSTIIKMDF